MTFSDVFARQLDPDLWIVEERVVIAAGRVYVWDDNITEFILSDAEAFAGWREGFDTARAAKKAELGLV